MNSTHIRAAAAFASACVLHASAFGVAPGISHPGLEGASSPIDLSATQIDSRFPGGENVDVLAAKDTKGRYVHRFEDLAIAADENGNIDGVATLRIVDGEEIVEEREMPLTGRFQCNFKSEEEVSLAEARGIPGDVSVRLENTIKSNAKVAGRTHGGGKPFMANLPLKQSFTRTTVDGIVTDEDGSSAFSGKFTTKAGEFGNGRADVEVHGWDPGQLEFAFAETSASPFGNGTGKWRTNCLVFTDEHPGDPIMGGQMTVVASFRDSSADRNGKATFNGRNGRFKVNAQGIVTTNGDEADEADFGPEDMEFFATKTLAIGPASQSLVQTRWGDGVIEQHED